MGIFDRVKDQLAVSRIEEETFYEAALEEIENGCRRPGLWAQAISKSAGDETAAKGLYVKLLVQKLKDEAHIAKRLRAQEIRELAQKEQEKRYREESERLQNEQKRRTELQTLQTSQAEDSASFAPMLLILVVIIVSILLFAFFNEPEDPQTAPDAEWVEERHEPSEYDKVVTYLENRYPPLNPDHRAFDQALLNQAAEGKDFYEQHGYSSIDAVLLAVNDIFGDLWTSDEEPNSQQSEQRRGTEDTDSVSIDPYPNCRFKGVMTDQDYRNCGLEPPRFD